MSKRDFIPNDDGSLATLLEKFTGALATHGTALGFSSTETTALAGDATYFRFVLTQQQRLRGVGQQWTAWKDTLRDGGDGTTTAVPAFPAAPTTTATAVVPGVVGRLRANARRAKASPAYSLAIGKALGIEGTEENAPDLDVLQPDLAAELAGDRVKVAWIRGKADALEIHVDRGDGKGFAFLAVDTVPDYIDTESIPAAPAVWKYKAIYRKNDERVGQWSAVVSVGLGA